MILRLNKTHLNYWCVSMQATGNNFRRSKSIENECSLIVSRSTYAERSDGAEVILHHCEWNSMDLLIQLLQWRQSSVYIEEKDVYNCLYRAKQIIIMACNFYWQICWHNFCRRSNQKSTIPISYHLHFFRYGGYVKNICLNRGSCKHWMNHTAALWMLSADEIHSIRISLS